MTSTLLNEFLPSPEQSLDLESEELGVFVLSYLARIEQKSPGNLNLNNFLISLREYALTRKEEVSEVFTEAWMWLEKELMLAPRRGDRDFFYVTRRGRTLIEHADLEAYKRGNLLGGMSLAPTLARKVRPTYMRDDYDTAVFQAFKEVEIQVRRKGGFGNDRIGVQLMRDAFNSESGPLADKAMELGEREAMSHLFAGAIGMLKNPSSHRDTALSDPQEAAEAILFANYLLRVVERLATAG